MESRQKDGLTYMEQVYSPDVQGSRPLLLINDELILTYPPDVRE